jgi:hypothetical protein
MGRAIATIVAGVQRYAGCSSDLACGFATTRLDFHLSEVLPPFALNTPIERETLYSN